MSKIFKHLNKHHDFINTLTGALTDTETAYATVKRIEHLLKTNEAFFKFGNDGYAKLNYGVDESQYGLHYGKGTYQAGRFTTPSIGELKNSFIPRFPDKITTKVLYGSFLYSDIARIIATSSKDTLYQLASQFNCLESCSPTVVDVAEYFKDNTQGPRGAIQAFPGALLRHYAAPMIKGTLFPETKRTNQTDANCLNLLDNVFSDEVAVVQAGYLQSSNVKYPEALLESLKDGFNQIKIGVHLWIDVPLTKYKESPHPTVVTNQALVSTISLGMSEKPIFVSIAKELLKAAYLGTILAASQNDLKQIVLTLVGGGAFNNPAPIIWEAMGWAIREAAPYISRETEIIINTFSKDKPAADLLDYLPEYEFLHAV